MNLMSKTKVYSILTVSFIFLSIFQIGSSEAFLVKNKKKEGSIVAFSLNLKANTYKEIIPAGGTGHCERYGLFCNLTKDSEDSLVLIYDEKLPQVAYFELITLGFIFSLDKELAIALNGLALYYTGVPVDLTGSLLVIEDIMNELTKMKVACVELVPRNGVLEYYGKNNCQVLQK